MASTRIIETAFSQYELLRPIGEGGAGRVWRATDSSGKDVAVKILAEERVTRERRKRFKNEILFSSHQSHPQLISVVDHGVIIGPPAIPFYVMPLLLGSLRDRFSVVTDFESRLVYFGQLLSGVEAAHLHGVIHRDLKPENVLYDASRDTVIIADFGVAHFLVEELYTAVETAPGSRLANFQYAAPEQRMRGGRTDARTDIYSLGLMLNELFTGEVPPGIGFKQVAVVAPGFAWVDDIVHRMLQTDPNSRPSSIDIIKQQFIYKKGDFAARQRLSEIANAVIPIAEEDDPLALEPPRIIDCVFENERLTLVLNRPVNPLWVLALNEGGYTSLWDKGPEVFTFVGDRATIPARESEVQQIIDYFKQWLAPTTAAYRKNRAQARRLAAEREKEQFRLEQEELERRRRVRANIRL